MRPTLLLTILAVLAACEAQKADALDLETCALGSAEPAKVPAYDV